MRPASPSRGAVSSRATLLEWSALRSPATSAVLKQRWWSPSPRLARNFPIGLSAPSGSSSSISLSPAASRAARTPCSRTVASRTSGRPSVSRQKP